MSLAALVVALAGGCLAAFVAACGDENEAHSLQESAKRPIAGQNGDDEGDSERAGCGVVRNRGPAFEAEVEGGAAACREARAVLASYLRSIRAGPGEGTGAYLRIRGWQCSVAPGALQDLARCTRGDEAKIVAVRPER